MAELEVAQEKMSKFLPPRVEVGVHVPDVATLLGQQDLSMTIAAIIIEQINDTLSLVVLFK